MAPCRCGKCPKCYFRIWYSANFFGGFRDYVLQRDTGSCVICHETRQIIVHHRRYVGDPDQMISLCAGHHAQIHHLKSHNKWLDPLVLSLWSELHPDMPVNLQLF